MRVSFNKVSVSIWCLWW